ncbi:Crp/Fnr family transcriptional regulator [Oricola sp.]|uniref:Crp/Fnr family transcriptional regulator n=1 Tax=Oricola sp. TaxID=1979950 RepID=UPI0025F7B09A|nr:Crp/Fnr family transcriptional regulator [Oricola sp.]MCI5077360.1 Crp/Fnr family transcriptional regulator [Oricola sp.]
MSAAIFQTLAAMAGDPRRLEPGESLFRQGDPVSSLFAVQSGMFRLVRYGAGGDAVVLQQARGGDTVAEASIYSDVYHCSAECVAAGSVLSVPAARFRERLRSDPAFAEEWTRYLARSIQNARARSEILAARTIEERLARWRAWFGDLPEKGQWKELAVEIGVTPEALYRALARGRRSG